MSYFIFFKDVLLNCFFYFFRKCLILLFLEIFIFLELGILGELDFLGIVSGLVFGGKYLDLDFDFWFGVIVLQLILGFDFVLVSNSMI